MFQIKPALWLVLGAACGAALGQQPTAQPAAEPPAPAPSYRSAFEGYQPFAGQDVAPWKESNETVRKAGGWRAYAREAQEGAARPAAPASSLVPPSGGDHKH
jgi:hypothetical protein